MNLRKSKYAALLISMVLVLSACGSSKGAIAEDKINVITTFYPIYEFAKEIGGEDANVINLLPTGVEAHDWTPKSQDIVQTSKAQLFLYNGAGMEGWVPGFLKGLDKNSEVKPVELSKGVSLINAEGDDGHGHGHSHGEPAEESPSTEEHDHDHSGETAAEKEHDHDHSGEAAAEEEHDHDHSGEAAEEEAHDHDHSDEAATNEEPVETEPAQAATNDSKYVDPHTWVSPKSAIIMADNIYKSMVEADPEHADGYQQRYEALKEKLVNLDNQFESGLSGIKDREIVVSHQAFGYLARDYNLKQHAIMGLSPDAEPRAQDIVKLAKTVKENNIRYIFFEELVSDQLARTLASETGVETLVLNPVEGLTKQQEQSGENYFTLMEKNLQNLQKALQ
ncbi:metal ABC transporter solute-binding protein, Zn/Mn family [Paenibacillus lemnae]|uniref:Zinc ABC transporter solute-binding protein n=1 Tax=Paenibacillus lemnae TaxID=1330551 RepID=A0A848M8B4_PAELE|nr:zinc ABC transporter substrate-binding protein [Paenibacillus lemnae]NMO96856.1 zinc ABC transporter solute-binding protein [Paenibacillus lemnae]